MQRLAAAATIRPSWDCAAKPCASSLKPNAAEVLLRALKTRGVAHLFADPGTDSASILEAFAQAERSALPCPVLCTHENLAVGMAHGHAMMHGQAEAVMVHMNVGAANALGALFNAAREFIPMVFMAGRTPITESGALESRNLNIHWAQEMFDQSAMLREAVKWDQEQRRPEQAEAALARAIALTRSDPQAPVALLLPREVLAAPVPPGTAAMEHPVIAPAAPDPAAIAAIAAALLGVSRPMIVTASAGRDVAVPAMLAEIAARFGIRVVEFRPRFHGLDNARPMHAGFEVDPWLAEADAIVVLECDVPWISSIRAPRQDARVFHIGPDPLFGPYPLHGFGGEVAIAARAVHAVPAFAEALAAITPPRDARIVARALGGPGPAALLVNEYPLVRSAMLLHHARGFHGSSPVGSPGWGLPAALGAKLAAPERLVVAALGDGSYIFASPVACHQTAAAQRPPVLTMVFDNGGYGTVERATQAMSPQGAAVVSGRIPPADFAVVPDDVRIIEACGRRGWRVDNAAELPAALEAAIACVQGGVQALVSVRVA